MAGADRERVLACVVDAVLKGYRDPGQVACGVLHRGEEPPRAAADAARAMLAAVDARGDPGGRGPRLAAELARLAKDGPTPETVRRLASAAAKFIRDEEDAAVAGAAPEEALAFAVDAVLAAGRGGDAFDLARGGARPSAEAAELAAGMLERLAAAPPGGAGDLTDALGRVAEAGGATRGTMQELADCVRRYMRDGNSLDRRFSLACRSRWQGAVGDKVSVGPLAVLRMVVRAAAFNGVRVATRNFLLEDQSGNYYSWSTAARTKVGRAVRVGQSLRLEATVAGHWKVGRSALGGRAVKVTRLSRPKVLELRRACHTGARPPTS